MIAVILLVICIIVIWYVYHSRERFDDDMPTAPSRFIIGGSVIDFNNGVATISSDVGDIHTNTHISDHAGMHVRESAPRSGIPTDSIITSSYVRAFGNLGGIGEGSLGSGLGFGGGGSPIPSPISSPVRTSSGITSNATEVNMSEFDWESAKIRASKAYLTTISAAKANDDGTRATSNELALTDSLTSQMVIDLPAINSDLIMPQTATDVVQRAPTTPDLLQTIQLSRPAIVVQEQSGRVTSPSTNALITRSGIYQPLGAERNDRHCGVNYNGATCGVGRCCSTDGWCGSGTQCILGANITAYNGPNAIITGKKTCALNCNEVPSIMSARYFYNRSRDANGKYIMTPTNIVTSGLNTCDIKYEYRLASDPTGFAVGADKRRFGFADAGTCNWQAIAMGPSGSGILA